MDSEDSPEPKSATGRRKALAVALVVTIVAMVALALTLQQSRGLEDRWEQVSETFTETWLGYEIVHPIDVTGKWVELRKDGTGINSDGDEFTWEVADGKLIFTDPPTRPDAQTIVFDYLLEGDTLTATVNFRDGVLKMVFRRA